MDIREGLKQIKNTDNILVSGTTEIIHEDGRFWEKGKTYHAELNYIPIEFEILDWEVKSPEPTLKDMLRKLKVREFYYDTCNYYLGCDPQDKKWTVDFDVTLKRFGNIYFDEDTLKQVVTYMNKKHITWNEFIKTWEEVQRERGE